MKSSPLIDFSFSAISSVIIAGLYQFKPDGLEFYIIATPIFISIIFIAIRYLAVLMQISSYENFAAVKSLKNRKKFLLGCLSDKCLSGATKEKYKKEYEEVTQAINKLLGG